jgi:hypothetical protein
LIILTAPANKSLPIRDDTSLLIRLVNDQTQQSKHIYDDNISAVRSLKNDLLTTMQQHRDSAQQSHDKILRTIGDQLAQLAQRSTALEKSERILKSLYCEEVHSREHQVSDAVDRTFDWAFTYSCSGHRFDCGCSCTDSQNKTLDLKCLRHHRSLVPSCTDTDSHQQHLLRWLKHHTNEPFVITGKPGSGKSTFMKIIGSHEQTRLALASWAGDNKLIMASFYFWSSGSPMQRSQEGLLRCLLYRILSQAPELIPNAVPGRWQAATDRLGTNAPWTRRDIADAFSSVINGNQLNVNLCFFIDGLDEYGGSDLGSGESDLDLVSQLKKLASSPHVKLCLSSRPRNVFQKHLISSESCHLILHIHTANDIKRFVQSRIESVQQLIDIDDSDLKKLQNLIAERSNGVFLWVVLVVWELLDGLEPPFSLLEMEERLLRLPEALDDYFQRILNKVHQHYRRFTARLLLMSSEPYGLELGSAYFLWLLDKEDVCCHNTTVTQQQQPYALPQSWKTDICLRVRKCCGDLLGTITEVASPYITHTHRSVADFLKLPEVRSQLLTYAGWQVSDIHLTFCRTYVSGIEHTVITNWEIPAMARSEFYGFMSHASKYELCSGKACPDLIHKLDSVFCSRLPGSETDDPSCHWTRLFLNVRFPNMVISDAHALLLCATIHGLFLFVDQTLKLLEPQAAVAALNCLLRALVLGCFHPHLRISGMPHMSAAVAFLCGKGANPNDIVRTPVSCTADHKTATLTWTIWELYLRQGPCKPVHELHVYENRGTDGDNRGAKGDNKYCVMERLIEGGADLECRMPVGCTSLQQVIERRLEKDYPGRKRQKYPERLKRVKTVLLNRGYIWVEAADRKG